MISIIVPVYNVEQYLRECLDSIVAQSFRDYEVILIDDGSTDSSGKISDDYAANNHYFKVFHQENSGVSVARNKGIELAKGEYIIFIDSDDSVEQSFLEIINNEIGEYDLMFYGDTYYFQNGNIQTHQPFSSESNDRVSIEKRLLAFKQSCDGYEYFGFTWNKVFRTNIIREHSIFFSEGLSLREDELFTAEYCKHIHSLKVISEPVYHYRVLNTGLSSKAKSAEVIEKYCDTLDKVSLGWSTKELYEYERFRYVSALFQAYHNANCYTTKWRIANKIHREYKKHSNPYLKPSKFFQSPQWFFKVVLLAKLLMRK